MAVIAKTDSPNTLLARLKKRIAEGTIRSWSVDDDGDFCHDAAQVKNKCCFRPEILDTELRFNLKWYKDVSKEPEFRAELHAHAVRMLMIHGGDGVESIEVTV